MQTPNKSKNKLHTPRESGKNISAFCRGKRWVNTRTLQMSSTTTFKKAELSILVLSAADSKKSVDDMKDTLLPRDSSVSMWGSEG